MEGLLTKDGTLYILPYNNWRIYLIDKMYSRLLIIHPGCDKIKKLLQIQYYWPIQANHMVIFLGNCQTYCRLYTFKDKKPGFLKLLPISEYIWQHISIDFKAVSKYRQKYNKIFVIICCFNKRTFSLPCFKTITA